MNIFFYFSQTVIKQMIKLFNHKHMKQTLLLLLALICLNAKAATADPVMTMTTSKNVGEAITFYLCANVANTVVQIDFGNGTLINKTIGINTSLISGTLGSKTVKIYGTNIIQLQCNQQQIIAIDVTKNITLKSLWFNDNQLSSLDVTQNTALTSLSCASNQLTSLDITNNTALSFLNCTNNQLSSFNVSMNTALKDLFCSNNQLSSLNVLQNTALTSLSCSSNQLSSLNVTNNTSLDALYCNSNQLTSLNVTMNTALTYLNCSNNQISSLNVTNNTLLIGLYCSNNQLTSLDVDNITALQYFYCNSNQLTSIDVTKNTELEWLYIGSNQLTFATLPLSKPTTFTYAPQKAINIAASFAPNTPIDLSSQLNANGNTTTYTWKTESGTTLTTGTDYTINNGVTTFIKVPAQKVYCEMTNTTFPYFSGADALKTTLTTIGTTSAVEDAKADVVDIYTQNQTMYLSLPADALVQVYDITGHLVKAQNCISGTNSFEVPQKGVFVVKVNMNNQSETRKIVVR